MLRPCCYHHPMHAAQDMSSFLSAGPKRYTARPFNMYTPKKTVWWVIPETDWPAYKYGKYIFWVDDKTLWCGLNIEKGLGLEPLKVYAKNRVNTMALQDDWIWHDFLEACRNGDAEGAISSVEQSYGAPVTIRVGIGAVVDPTEFEPLEGISNTVEFKCASGSLEVITDDINNEDFRRLAWVKSLADLYNFFQNNPLDWFWVDMNVVMPFQVLSEGEKCEEGCDAEWIYENIFAPLEKWVR